MPPADIRPRVALIDDHPLVRRGLADLLIAELAADIVFSSERMDDLLSVTPPPDLVLLDLDLGDSTPDIALVQHLVSSGVAILVVSALGAPQAIRDMVRAGVAAFISKQRSSEELLDAVRAVLTEGTWTGSEVAAIIAADPARPRLSPQEERVLVLYASGMKLQTVARRTGITEGTAKTYLKRIRQKYEDLGRPAHTKTDLYREAVRDGILDQNGP